MHTADENLLLYADGELSSKEMAAIRAHLGSCWECRTRLAEMEGTIGNFIRAYREQAEDIIPPPEGPRALLRAQMRQLLAGPQGMVAMNGLFRSKWLLAIVIAAAAIGAESLMLLRVHPRLRDGAVPQPGLTPGETVSVTAREVCSPDFPGEYQVAIPNSLKHRVFEEYGLTQPAADAFKVDYLINPDLGGATSVRNLWPEPSKNTLWNAQVKDQLESSLKELVCSGKVDLRTAQRDLAKDWIESYKKYFRTDGPVAGDFRPNSTLARSF